MAQRIFRIANMITAPLLVFLFTHTALSKLVEWRTSEEVTVQRHCGGDRGGSPCDRITGRRVTDHTGHTVERSICVRTREMEKANRHDDVP